jgi:integrase
VEKQKGRTGALSGQFYRVMVAAGLVPHRSHHTQGQAGGRSGKRTPGELSFHSLRHTATSLMKNAGISSAIVQDIIGHESAAVSAHYTHIDGDAKRSALAALPDLQAGT